ncbi:MAG: cation transporter [Clostridia bacterium]|nr:cation transporter [Clostridia bacterium]
MKKIFEVEDLDCAHCAAKIEKAVSQLEGVNEVTVSFLTQKITLDAQDDKFDAVVKEMVKIAKKTEPDMEILGI